MKKIWILVFALTFLLASCTTDNPSAATPESEANPAVEEAQDAAATSDEPSEAETTDEVMDAMEAENSEPSLGQDASPSDEVDLVDGGVPPRGAESEFTTDFSITSIPFDEILSGGIAKDGIPALDAPVFVSIADAEAWLADTEPVVVIDIEGVAKAYPIQILTWHEIVNDEINGLPVAVTFCPLCNSTLAFERAFGGVIYDFGTTGRLRNSNLVMYDRQTESWWQQATGEAVIGELTGTMLERVPAPMTSFVDFKAAYPEGEVLSIETGYVRNYGTNPYAGYDTPGNFPFLFDGRVSGELDPVEYVLGVEVNNAASAYPFSLLREEIVINDTIDGVPVVVFWQPGTNAALGASEIASAADIGAATAFERTVDGMELTFSEMDGVIFDMETGTTWDLFGSAVKGALEEEQLSPVTSANHFWFSWQSFHPNTAVYGIDMLEELNAEAEPGTVTVAYDFPIQPYQGFTQEELALTDVFQDGKPTVVNFFASGCPICVAEMDDLQDAYEAFGDSINFVAIDIGPYVGLGTNDGALLLLAEKGATFPAGNTPDIQVLREYNVLGTPTTVFFHSDGSISEIFTGALGFEGLERFISELQ